MRPIRFSAWNIAATLLGVAAVFHPSPCWADAQCTGNAPTGSSCDATPPTGDVSSCFTLQISVAAGYTGYVQAAVSDACVVGGNSPNSEASIACPFLVAGVTSTTCGSGGPVTCPVSSSTPAKISSTSLLHGTAGGIGVLPAVGGYTVSETAVSCP